MGAQLVNEPGTYCWSELITTDLEASKAFYKAVFGWDAEDQGPPGGPPAYTEWKLDGRSVGGMMLKSADMPADMPPNWGVYFAVADTDATVAKAQELGRRRCSWARPTSSRGGSPSWPTTVGAVFNVLQLKALAGSGPWSGVASGGPATRAAWPSSAAPPAGPPRVEEAGHGSRLALDRGVNHLDIAPQYGAAESVVGPHLAAHRERALHRRQDAAGQPRRRGGPVRPHPAPAQRRGARPLPGPCRDDAGGARPSFGRARADPRASATRGLHPLRRHHRPRPDGAACPSSRRCAASISTR